MRRGAKLAGQDVRHGVQCGGARRHSKSLYSAAIKARRAIAACQPLAVDRLLLERAVAGDGDDLVHRASGLGQPAGCGLAQAVHDAALRQSLRHRHNAFGYTPRDNFTPPRTPGFFFLSRFFGGGGRGVDQ